MLLSTINHLLVYLASLTSQKDIGTMRIIIILSITLAIFLAIDAASFNGGFRKSFWSEVDYQGKVIREHFLRGWNDKQYLRYPT